MNEPEKPLHVQVAEALGCKSSFVYGSWFCNCQEDSHRSDEGAGRVAEYDTDWNATGPHMEGLKIAAYFVHGADEWEAMQDLCRGPGQPIARGSTPLIAVCNLILALHKAGKLGGGE